MVSLLFLCCEPLRGVLSVKNSQSPHWREFFRKYYRIAVRFARSFTKDEEAAEDVFQEAALSVYHRVAEGRVAFDSNPQFRHYFFKTIKSTAINWQKHRQRQSTIKLEQVDNVAIEGTPLAEILQKEMDEEMERRIGYCLNILKGARKQERDIIFMRFFQQMSYKEISTRLNEPISTLQSREKAFLKKLRKKFGKNIHLLLYI